MTSRDATAIKAAAERLLAGTPLRSASGKLTATELIVESGLRRDVVYPHHQDRVDEFRLRAGAQGRVSPPRKSSPSGTRPSSTS